LRVSVFAVALCNLTFPDPLPHVHIKSPPSGFSMSRLKIKS